MADLGIIPIKFMKEHVVRSVIIGPYQLSGVSQLDGIAFSCRVSLHRRQDGRLIKEARSAVNGSFTFTDIPYMQYFVIAYQDLPASPQFNARILDDVYPVAM